MIGILTFHTQYNYGSVLQAYALQKAIEKLGHENRIINFYYEKNMSQYNIRWRSGAKVAIFDLLTYPLSSARKKAYHKFLEANIKMTAETRSEDGVKELTANYDTLVCGSDQIWNMGLVGGVNPVYFLRFAASDQKKVSYAPSIAVKGSIEQNREELKTALLDYHAISIRENSFADELERITGRPVCSVLDPTLLLEAEDYDRLIKNYSLKLPPKYIFVYSIHHASLGVLQKAAEKMAKEQNAQIVYFNKYPILRSPYAKNIFTYDPRAFVLAIKNASYVLSDSFHAGVFSVIYKTQFATKIMDDSRSRMDDFFEKFSLGDRYIKDDFSALPAINYEVAHQRWAKEKEKSVDYLRMALEEQ